MTDEISTEAACLSQPNLEDDDPETNKLGIQTELNLAAYATESLPGVSSLLYDFL
jgi:hypothetical protein